MKRNTIIIAACGIALLSMSAWKYTHPSGNHGMDHAIDAATENNPASKAYRVAMATMMQGMMVAPTSKPDLDFMQGMIPHHQGAIDMAKVVLQFGKDPDIRKFAQNVVTAQEGEITFMKAWIARTDANVLATSSDARNAAALAMTKMMANMMVPPTGDADVDFVIGMMPHHQGAIDSAKVAIKYAKDPAVLKLAQDIVTAQEAEIAVMKIWLTRKVL